MSIVMKGLDSRPCAHTSTENSCGRDLKEKPPIEVSAILTQSNVLRLGIVPGNERARIVHWINHLEWPKNDGVLPVVSSHSAIEDISTRIRGDFQNALQRGNYRWVRDLLSSQREQGDLAWFKGALGDISVPQRGALLGVVAELGNVEMLGMVLSSGHIHDGDIRDASNSILKKGSPELFETMFSQPRLKRIFSCPSTSGVEIRSLLHSLVLLGNPGISKIAVTFADSSPILRKEILQAFLRELDPTKVPEILSSLNITEQERGESLCFVAEQANEVALRVLLSSGTISNDLVGRALVLASKRGWLEGVSILLSNPGISVDSIDHSLSVSVENKHLGLVQKLLEKGVSENGRGKALCIASGNKYKPAFFDIIVQSGSISIEHRGQAVCIAAGYNRKDRISTLLSNGATISKEDEVTKNRYLEGWQKG